MGSIGTVEHLMSAFAGLEITDAEVELDAPEVPGMDGSAGPFYDSMLTVGLQDLGHWTPPVPYRRVFYQRDSVKIAVSRGEGHWRCVYDTGQRWPGSQRFELRSLPAEYADAVGRARTFALLEEVEAIRAAGLGLGLDESSALILGTSAYENAARFADEPVRHKLLDVIGDLYLAGIPIRHLNVSAERSGHTANVECAVLLKRAADIKH